MLPTLQFYLFKTQSSHAKPTPWSSEISGVGKLDWTCWHTTSKKRPQHFCLAWVAPAFFFFSSSLSHLFITMLCPGPAAVSILIKANRPTNRCSWSCPLDSCQGMWSLSWGDLPLPNPLLRFQSRACVLGQLMSVCVFRAWHLSWHHGLKLVGVVGSGGPMQDREPPRVISLSIYFLFLFLPRNSSSDNPMSPSPSCNYLKIFSKNITAWLF